MSSWSDTLSAPCTSRRLSSGYSLLTDHTHTHEWQSARCCQQWRHRFLDHASRVHDQEQEYTSVAREHCRAAHAVGLHYRYALGRFTKVHGSVSLARHRAYGSHSLLASTNRLAHSTDRELLVRYVHTLYPYDSRRCDAFAPIANVLSIPCYRLVALYRQRLL